ncbi:macrophage mannose receptor 1-like isoform X2 [Procambarus clarkii]|uniref:macrophage mannose receptor 1-like isoform X1 n=1 Tax=Procambarus clarkii TaxID=6728 RepID=UPI003742B576
MKRAATVALAFAAALTVASCQVNPCPFPYENFGTDPMSPMCIKFYMTEKGSWDHMRALCRAEGADLADLRNGLHNYVYQYIMQHPDLQDEGFWIGGKDEDHEGIWTWVSDGGDMDIFSPDWYPGQPDGGLDQNFACIYTPDFYYHSCANNILIYALCQI